MTWQCRPTMRQRYIRMLVLVVIVGAFGRTDWLMSNAYWLQTSQTERGISRPDASAFLRGADWDLTGIAAIDKDVVWVVGNVLDFLPDGKPRSPLAALNASKGIVLRSTDGGQSWTIQCVEPGKYLLNVHFVDKMNGWVSDASDLILKTEDAGLTWTRLTAPLKSFWGNIQFVDSRRGWILGAEGVVLRTEDGGLNWRLTKIPTGVDLSFFGFADENTGWVVGGKGAAFETTDSGTHWRSRADDLSRLLTNDKDSEIYFRKIKFVTPTVGFLAADIRSKQGTSNAKAVVFRTLDRGRTWAAQTVPRALGIRTVEFLTDKEAWIVPGYRARPFAFHTEDGGLNWSTLRLPRNCAPSRLLFVDSKHGWFLNTTDNFSSDQIFRTTDGGKTWLEIKISQRIAPS